MVLPNPTAGVSAECLYNLGTAMAAQVQASGADNQRVSQAISTSLSFFMRLMEKGDGEEMACVGI